MFPQNPRLLGVDFLGAADPSRGASFNARQSWELHLDEAADSWYTKYNNLKNWSV